MRCALADGGQQIVPASRRPQRVNSGVAICSERRRVVVEGEDVAALARPRQQLEVVAFDLSGRPEIIVGAHPQSVDYLIAEVGRDGGTGAVPAGSGTQSRLNNAILLRANIRSRHTCASFARKTPQMLPDIEERSYDGAGFRAIPA